MLLYTLFDKYQNTLSNDNTKNSYSSLINIFKRYFKNVEISEITTEMIQNFVNEMQKNNLKEITLYNYYKALKTIFNFAVNNNYIDKNVCEKVKIKHIVYVDRHIDYSKKYVKKLLKIFKHTKIYYHIVTMLHTRR